MTQIMPEYFQSSCPRGKEIDRSGCIGGTEVVGSFKLKDKHKVLKFNPKQVGDFERSSSGGAE